MNDCFDELARLDIEAEFLLQFPHETSFERFIALAFAAGKLPKPAEMIRVPTLCDQELSVPKDQPSRHLERNPGWSKAAHGVCRVVGSSYPAPRTIRAGRLSQKWETRISKSETKSKLTTSNQENKDCMRISSFILIIRISVVSYFVLRTSNFL